jgi:hypothetical protein
MKRWKVVVHIPGQPDETISLTEASRKSLLVEAKTRGVHPDVVLRESYLEWRSKQQTWLDLETAAKRCVELSKTHAGHINHDSLAVTLQAIVAILRASVSRGAPGGVQNVVMAADLLAAEIERVHKLHPKKLRKVAENLPKLAVLISRGAVADDNPERKSVREFLVRTGVGEKSNPPTGTKTQTDTIWMEFASTTLNNIIMMKDALDYQSEGNAFMDSLVAPHREKAEKIRECLESLPSLSLKNVAPWWQVAKELIEAYWQANPAEAEVAEKKAVDDKRCQRREEKPRTFAIAKVYESFRALVRAKGKDKMG